MTGEEDTQGGELPMVVAAKNRRIKMTRRPGAQDLDESNVVDSI